MSSCFKRFKNWILYPRQYRNFIEHLEVSRLSSSAFADNALRHEIYTTYRDVFGHGGDNEWGEYVKCQACSMVYDIETIHGINAYVQLSVLPAHPPSSRCCGAPLE